ncbi:NAD-dependent epimerase/dehydratase family protein [Methylophilus methylotrophus]|uniref:NAD-dependent epimerase/dehydratase family protein n=1 Tax=Methylophilus methylotrophus TaxID=17 RepID=UPI000F5AD664|nr:NAD-dependent epimerase/dehydratase family protein [Methylophilus methylotrophus]
MRSMLGENIECFDMRILITGASGFIGKACLPAFVNAGYQVRACSRHQVDQPHVEYVNIPAISGDTDWSTALQDIDVVIHLAGIAHAPKTERHLYHDVNVKGTCKLLLDAIEAKVQHFIFVSSIAVHGRTHTALVDEHTQFQPENAYAQSKLDAELAIQNISADHQISWTILRPPMVYGMHAPGNFDRLIKLVKTGIPLPLYGARSLRSYISVDNLVSCLLTITKSDKARNNCFVVSDDNDISTAELIMRIAELMGKPPRLWWFPETGLKWAGLVTGYIEEIKKLFDPFQINCSKLKNELGWIPVISLKNGLQQAIITRNSNLKESS